MEARVRDLRDLRDEHVELEKERDAARDAFVAVDTTAADLIDTAEYRKAQAAVKRLNDHDALLRKAQDDQVAVLKLISGETNGAALPAGESEHREAVNSLRNTPRAWLAAVLQRRKQDVSTLPDDIRFKAASAFLDTSAISTLAETEAMIDLLAPQSVAIASGIVTLPIDTTKTRIPRFTDLPTAAWIPERGAFPKSAPGIEMVEVEQPKVGLDSPLSVEVFDDLTPLGLSMGVAVVQEVSASDQVGERAREEMEDREDVVAGPRVGASARALDELRQLVGGRSVGVEHLAAHARGEVELGEHPARVDAVVSLGVHRG
jgi:hypothetical protein